MKVMRVLVEIETDDGEKHHVQADFSNEETNLGPVFRLRTIMEKSVPYAENFRLKYFPNKKQMEITAKIPLDLDG